MRLDLFNNLDFKRALSPVSVADNTAQVTEILDMQGAESAVLAILTGAIADADATFSVLLEEGDAANLSDASAVLDIDLLGTELLAAFQFDDDNVLRKLGYKGSKRYIRGTITPAANAAAALLAAVWIKGDLRDAPSANPPT